MTGSARLTEMGTFQFEICFRMIKLNITPIIAAVATLTAFFRVIRFIQVRFMNIIMTIDTFFTNLPETPFGILFMTGETGSSQVCTLQLKFALIMPLNCEVRLFKAQGGMTIGKSEELPFRVNCLLW